MAETLDPSLELSPSGVVTNVDDVRNERNKAVLRVRFGASLSQFKAVGICIWRHKGSLFTIMDVIKELDTSGKANYDWTPAVEPVGHRVITGVLILKLFSPM